MGGYRCALQLEDDRCFAWLKVLTVSGDMSAEEAGGFVEVDKVLEEGIKRVKKGALTWHCCRDVLSQRRPTAAQRGDPHLRLERYLVRFVRCLSSA